MTTDANKNKIYPATDVDDYGNMTGYANVNPISGDEYSALEGSDTIKQDKRQNMGARSRIQVVGYDQNANPITAPANPHLNDMKTVDVDDLADPKMGSYNSKAHTRSNFGARTSAGFNTQSSLGAQSALTGGAF